MSKPPVPDLDVSELLEALERCRDAYSGAEAELLALRPVVEAAARAVDARRERAVPAVGELDELAVAVDDWRALSGQAASPEPMTYDEFENQMEAATFAPWVKALRADAAKADPPVLESELQTSTDPIPDFLIPDFLARTRATLQEAVDEAGVQADITVMSATTWDGKPFVGRDEDQP